MAKEKSVNKKKNANINYKTEVLKVYLLLAYCPLTLLMGNCVRVSEGTKKEFKETIKRKISHNISMTKKC